jgi:predicted dienelactone hydrolase
MHTGGKDHLGRGREILRTAAAPGAAIVAAVDGSLPAKHEYHVVPNAGHFAFTMICPPALAKNNPEGCTDAPGFDRAAFHKEFNAAVLAFFRANLGGT